MFELISLNKLLNMSTLLLYSSLEFKSIPGLLGGFNSMVFIFFVLLSAALSVTSELLTTGSLSSESPSHSSGFLFSLLVKFLLVMCSLFIIISLVLLLISIKELLQEPLWSINFISFIVNTRI
uniref:Uncharacterized protein n=1 Tax=Cacopsylla melanoneura TaxID=428564 RepID=A0A8D8YQ55_9HEMI